MKFMTGFRTLIFLSQFAGGVGFAANDLIPENSHKLEAACEPCQNVSVTFVSSLKDTSQDILSKTSEQNKQDEEMKIRLEKKKKHMLKMIALSSCPGSGDGDDGPGEPDGDEGPDSMPPGNDRPERPFGGGPKKDFAKGDAAIEEDADFKDEIREAKREKVRECRAEARRIKLEERKERAQELKELREQKALLEDSDSKSTLGGALSQAGAGFNSGGAQMQSPQMQGSQAGSQYPYTNYGLGSSAYYGNFMGGASLGGGFYSGLGNYSNYWMMQNIRSPYYASGPFSSTSGR